MKLAVLYHETKCIINSASPMKHVMLEPVLPSINFNHSFSLYYES